MASSSPIWSVVDSTHTWPRESTVDDVDYVLHGRFDHLPPAPSKVVRIFLSSTFTDTYVERNLLIKRVYPKLQRICKEKYDLDFQVMLCWIHHKFDQTYVCWFISSFNCVYWGGFVVLKSVCTSQFVLCWVFEEIFVLSSAVVCSTFYSAMCLFVFFLGLKKNHLLEIAFN